MGPAAFWRLNGIEDSAEEDLLVNLWGSRDGLAHGPDVDGLGDANGLSRLEEDCAFEVDEEVVRELSIAIAGGSDGQEYLGPDHHFLAEGDVEGPDVGELEQDVPGLDGVEAWA